MALDRTTLDLMASRGCQSLGCDHTGHERTIYIHAKCHIAAGLWASYTIGEGVLVITCKQCKAVVARVAVSEGA